MNKKIEGELLADRAQAALWNAFRAGTLREGEFLSISQLVEILGCPIAAVRDAVKHAQSKRLLIAMPKRGLRVMEANPETIRRCLDYRMVLDTAGAMRRIESGDMDGLDLIKADHTDLLEAARRDHAKSLPQTAIKTDLTLHDFLAKGLGNTLLGDDYETNRLRIAIIQNARPFLRDRIVSAMEEHLAIIAALEAGDAAAAAESIRVHFNQTLRWWGVAP